MAEKKQLINFEKQRVFFLTLFKNLFGFDLLNEAKPINELDLERYLEIWGRFEFVIQSRNKSGGTFEKSTIEILNELANKNYIDKSDLIIIEEYRDYRNRIIHSQMKVNDIPLPQKENYIPYMTSIMRKIQGIEI